MVMVMVVVMVMGVGVVMGVWTVSGFGRLVCRRRGRVEGAMKFGMLGYAYGHCGTWMTWVRRHDGVGKPVDGTEKITRWRV